MDAVSSLAGYKFSVMRKISLAVIGIAAYFAVVMISRFNLLINLLFMYLKLQIGKCMLRNANQSECNKL